MKKGNIWQEHISLLKFMYDNRHLDFMQTLIWSKTIAKYMKISRYKALQLLKTLREQWMVVYEPMIYCEKDYESWECYCENHLPIRWWRITELWALSHELRLWVILENKSEK